jgi:GNAT superfamily N-acetyltransferase
MTTVMEIRNAEPSEFGEIGRLMVHVYSQLDGFPQRAEQPEYFKMLENVGELAKNPGTQILVAVSADRGIAGAVVYLGDLGYYGSGGTISEKKNASGFRLLCVDPGERGKGLGRLLAMECIRKAKDKNHSQVIIHSTKVMVTAWRMYENMGFKRAEDLDFKQGSFPVFGFRLLI